MCTKKVISVILAVLMLFVSLSSLTAFAEEKYPPLESGVYGYIDENKYPIKKNENHMVVKELDPALELQVKQDYIALNPYNGKGEEATTDDVVVEYYGTLSDGSMLVCPYTADSIWLEQVTCQVIGKYVYMLPNRTLSKWGKDAKIYKNHQFYGIMDSYIEGSLSDDLLDEIADILCFGEFVNPNETKPSFDESYDKTYSITREPEEKYICDTTIDSDFIDNQIIVCLFNEASLKFKKYTVGDFKDLGVVSVIQSSMDKEMGDKVEAKITEFCNKAVSELELAPEYFDVLKDALIKNELDSLEIADWLTDLVNEQVELGEMLEYIYKYNQTLLLTLDTHDKQNVLDTVKELEKNDDIMIAQPDGIYIVDDPDPTQPETTKPLATPDTPGESDNKNPQNNNSNNANGAVPTGQNNPLFAVCILLTLSICGVVFAVKLKTVKK